MESAINEYENLTFFFMGMKTPKERRNELGGYAFPINVGACSATFGKDKFTRRLAPYARASRFPVGIGSDERSRWITLLTYPLNSVFSANLPHLSQASASVRYRASFFWCICPRPPYFAYTII